LCNKILTNENKFYPAIQFSNKNAGIFMLNPNPTNNNNGFWLQSLTSESLSGQLFIFDASGKELSRFKLENEQVKFIATDSFKAGMYLIRWINSSNETQLEKLIIQ